MKLENKEALVTGGSTGIGRATAELFATEGARVHIVDYNEEEGQAAVAKIEAAGGRACFYATDVRSEESVASAIAQVKEATPHIDVAVFAAVTLLRRAPGRGPAPPPAPPSSRQPPQA